MLYRLNRLLQMGTRDGNADQSGNGAQDSTNQNGNGAQGGAGQQIAGKQCRRIREARMSAQQIQVQAKSDSDGKNFKRVLR